MFYDAIVPIRTWTVIETSKKMAQNVQQIVSNKQVHIQFRAIQMHDSWMSNDALHTKI